MFFREIPGAQRNNITHNNMNLKHKSNAKTNLTLLHQNVDRLSNKIDLVTDMLRHIKPDILILTEHGLSDINLENTRLDGYKLADFFARKDHLKGGVAIYINEVLECEYSSIDTAKNCSIELVCEMAAVKLNYKKEEYIVVGIYRPDRGFEDAADAMSELLNTIPTWKSTVVVMGDVNVDSLKQSSNKTKLKNLLLSYNIRRLDLPPTRKTPTSSTSIDMIASNVPVNDLSTRILQTYISDHTGQTCSIRLADSISSTIKNTSRALNEQNLQIIRRLLEKENWEDVYTEISAEAAYNTFLGIITYHLDYVCPAVKSRKKGRGKKFQTQDSNILKIKKSFQKAHDAYLLSGTDEKKRLAFTLKKEYDLMLKNSKKAQNSKIIYEAPNKSKALWNIINNNRKAVATPNKTLNLEIDGETISDPARVAGQFNAYFTNIAENILAQTTAGSENTQHRIQPAELDNCLILWPTTQEEILNTIKSMKPKTSAGIDEISTKFLKICATSLVNPLTDIINKSFLQGVFPSKLKSAKVYPKFKNGNAKHKENFRPISVLPTFSKLFEKIALARLLNHLEKYNLLPDEQHGFRTGKSTTTALAALSEYIVTSLDSGDTISAVFLDYSKAFDCLGHELLLDKLNAIGVRDLSARWFQSYLHGRTQMVEVTSTENGETRKTTSNPLAIKRGVPQGSVLGPVLFIIFASDLPTFLSDCCNTLMFADDTALLLRNTSLEHLEIQSYIAVNMAQQYCQTNQLVLNEKKSQHMLLGKGKDKLPGLPELKEVNKTKYLGMIIDGNFTWKEHVEQLCGKLSSALYVLKRVSQICNTDTVRTAYFALFETYMRYGLAVWGGSLKGNMDRVLILQKSAIRVLARLSPRDSCRRYFKELNILTVVGLYILESSLYAQSRQPTRGADTHNHNTRSAMNFTLPAHRLKIFEKQPAYMGAKFLNLLPEEVKAATTIKGQRKRIYKWLADRPFYSVEEFLTYSEH